MANYLAFISTVIISLSSLTAMLFSRLRKNPTQKAIYSLMSVSAGTLLGNVLFHTLPDGLEENASQFFLLMFSGFIIFFILHSLFGGHNHEHLPQEEKTCHHKKHKKIGMLSLISDGVHNILDGAFIASAYLASTELGILASIAVFLHEVPQELGDYAILIHSGYSVKKAMLYNFFVSCGIILGAGIVIIIGTSLGDVSHIMEALMSGTLLYMFWILVQTLWDVKKDFSLKKSSLFFLLGFIILFLVAFLEHE